MALPPNSFGKMGGNQWDALRASHLLALKKPLSSVLMRAGRLELPASPLSVECSNHLSYARKFLVLGSVKVKSIFLLKNLSTPPRAVALRPCADGSYHRLTLTTCLPAIAS